MKIKLRFLTLILVLLFSFSYSGFGQETIVTLNGKVKSSSNDVSDVLVVNLSSQKSTITNNEGAFSIEAKLNDSIQFTAVQYLTKKIMVTNTILNTSLMLIHLVDNIVKLDEVTVMPYSLSGNIDLDIKRIGNGPVTTASSLKLPNSNVQVITHNERLLLEADRGKFIKGGIQLDTLFFFPIVSIYMDLNVHKTLNYISGRTKKLKEIVSVDEDIKMEKKSSICSQKKPYRKNLESLLKILMAFLLFVSHKKTFPTYPVRGIPLKFGNTLWPRAMSSKETGSFRKTAFYLVLSSSLFFN